MAFKQTDAEAPDDSYATAPAQTLLQKLMQTKASPSSFKSAMKKKRKHGKS